MQVLVGLLAKKLIFFSIIPLILSIGIIPALPFADAGMQELTECIASQVLIFSYDSWILSMQNI